MNGSTELNRAIKQARKAGNFQLVKWLNELKQLRKQNENKESLKGTI